MRSMIEWLAFFGETESNGVTRILYSKERMSAQQAMKAEDGKKLIIYFDSVCFRGASGGINLTSSHMETDKDGGNMAAHMGASAILSAAPLYGENH
ncbi:allantoate amidohydrolase [Peribacillus simplex]|uniref:Allantoate amidohydrolase n=2 Tax=Bacillales TaxID=1385 RepID=A0AAN2TRD6_9BACI|nr:allantoate amidohydrolase [Peribacillus simplex]